MDEILAVCLGCPRSEKSLDEALQIKQTIVTLRSPIRYRPQKLILLKSASFDRVALADSKNVIFNILRTISVEIAVCVVSGRDVTIRDAEIILPMLM